MIDVDRQVCEFVPRNRREALAWYWGCGDYSLADAWALRPLEISPAHVRRCLRVRARRVGAPDEYVVDFTQSQHNRIVAARLPPGFPLKLVEDGRGADYLRALLREQLAVLPRGLTVFWFGAALLALASIQVAAPYVAPLLARRAASPDCAGACPTIVAHGTLIAATGLVPLMLGLLLPPLRYRWLLARYRLSAVLRATVRTELLLLTGLNAFFVFALAWRLYRSAPILAIVLGMARR